MSNFVGEPIPEEDLLRAEIEALKEKVRLLATENAALRQRLVVVATAAALANKDDPIWT